MSKEMLVMLHPEPLTERLLRAAEKQIGEELVRRHEKTEKRPAVIQVLCTQVEATAYGLVRLVLKENAPQLAVSVHQALLVGMLDTQGRNAIGFLDS